MFGDNLERIVAAIEKNYEADEIFFTKPGRRFPSRTAIKGRAGDAVAFHEPQLLHRSDAYRH